MKSPCDCCRVIRAHYPRDPWEYRKHNPACLHCGARVIQWLQRKSQRGQSEVRERCREMLALWMRHGHPEVDLRAMAKEKTWAVRPGKGAKC